MNNQYDLLADLPRARRTDSESSHEAAERIAKSGRLAIQQAAVRLFVFSFPGKTAIELAHLMSEAEERPYRDWRYYHDWTRRRLPELIAHVRKGPIRKCTKSGNSACTWFPK